MLEELKIAARKVQGERDLRGLLSQCNKTGARYALVLIGSPIATALVERAGWSQIGQDAGFVLLRAT